MGLLKPIREYKDKVMEAILSDQRVIDLINDPENLTTPALGLRYRRVFPYAFIPPTTDDAATFVCFEANISNVKSDTICDVELTIFVSSHTRIMQAEGGTRIDVLADAIDDLLNHSRDFGIGKLTPNTRYPTEYNLPNYDYICRKVKYIAKDYNFRHGARDT